MLYTIGHSNHEIEVFLRLLRQHGITALADVRTSPYSRYAPQFSQDALKHALAQAGIAFVYLGRELGGRSDNPACYEQGRVNYDRMAHEPAFAEGIRRILDGMDRYCTAIMCSEKDPVNCHRALLVSRHLSGLGAEIEHIHADGALEPHRALESRLLLLCRLPAGDLFTTRDEYLSDAYSLQANRVAYQDESMEDVERTATA